MNLDAPMVDCAPGATLVGYQRLHPNRGIEFQCNRFLQLIGPAALDEIRATAGGIAGYADWISVFLGLAARARADGRALAGAYYDRAAGFFMHPDDARRGPARDRFVRAMREIYEAHPEPVPYQGGHLPAYDLAPDGPTRGTIVVFGGFDEYIEENFPLLAVAVHAGYRIIAFDGPGQGGALEDDRIAMTPEWERPVGAVCDHFDLSEVTLVGISLGGGLAIRAAAFESRARRVVALDVLDDFLECLTRQVGPGLTPALRLLLATRARPILNLAAGVAQAHKPIAEWGISQGMHVTGAPSAYHFFKAARTLSTQRVSSRVTADVLLLAGAKDHYVPRHQLYRQAAALTHARSVTTRLFTPAEQAHNHCQIGNVGAALRTMLAWIESR